LFLAPIVILTDSLKMNIFLFLISNIHCDFSSFTGLFIYANGIDKLQNDVYIVNNTLWSRPECLCCNVEVLNISNIVVGQCLIESPFLSVSGEIIQIYIYILYCFIYI
jgi:hypothetical protein